MEILKKLSPEEQKQVLLAPVLISLLAANADGELDDSKKATAIKLTHCKTFTSPPELKDFYKEVEKEFEKNIDYYNEELPKSQTVRKRVLEQELQKIAPSILKLGEEDSTKIYKSLQSYTQHVSKAHWNVPNDPLICFELEGIPTF